ncbi:hypothetical protein M422DRAFT_785190 [Sphaerobolus stellatus SS14]|uniref:Unplaced genomic scaffold SPHSTscaffold_289, whole genome shotgun sequence n=1 Tax=Sphaerobolus stellatus (strain SS14) TaxID=990650 RepID=A0A0C9UBS9_SPHS4|nr:hypothetical protein M422DRAFT_785190 [Sphaerobolus stellatus SS14]
MCMYGNQSQAIYTLCGDTVSEAFYDDCRSPYCVRSRAHPPNCNNGRPDCARCAQLRAPCSSNHHCCANPRPTTRAPRTIHGFCSPKCPKRR